MNNTLKQLLQEKGWTEIMQVMEYRKGNWKLIADTSSWWIVSTDSNPRVFDVAAPSEHLAAWTVNLIEHLCKMEDERTRLRSNLTQIQNTTNVIQTIAFAQQTLEECYHTWLVDDNKFKCPICGKIKMN